MAQDLEDIVERQITTVLVEREDGDISPVELHYVRPVGKGVGSSLSLYQRNYGHGNQLIVEKTFKSPGGLKGLVASVANLAAFQTPNPRRRNYHAVRADYYRRKVVSLLSEYWFGESRMADATHTRFDKETDAFVLGMEFVDGRGYEYSDKETLKFMKELTSHLYSSGFAGLTWQVKPSLLYTTTNVRIPASGKAVLVDLESSIPAILTLDPTYWATGLRTGNFPLFDDVDYKKLRRYMEKHSSGLEQKIGSDNHRTLLQHVEQLQLHERQWKMSEVALWRHSLHVLSKPQAAKAYFRQIFSSFTEKYAEYHLRSGEIDDEEASNLKTGKVTLLEQMVRDFVFFSSIRKFEDVDYITAEQAGRLRKEASEARLQKKDLAGAFFTSAGLDMVTPLSTVGALSFFAVFRDPHALALLAFSPAVRTSYTLAAFSYLKLKSMWKKDVEPKQNRHWPWIFGLGLIPVVGNFAYTASILLDVKNNSELYGIAARGLVVRALDKIPFYGDYNSRLSQAALRVYDKLSGK